MCIKLIETYVYIRKAVSIYEWSMNLKHFIIGITVTFVAWIGFQFRLARQTLISLYITQNYNTIIVANTDIDNTSDHKHALLSSKYSTTSFNQTKTSNSAFNHVILNDTINRFENKARITKSKYKQQREKQRDSHHNGKSSKSHLSNKQKYHPSGNIYFLSNNSKEFATNQRCSKVSKQRIVIATIAFYDESSQRIIRNHQNYANANGYDYFILKHIITNQYQDTGAFGTQQRVMMIYNLLFDKNFEMNAHFGTTYDIVLYIDFDAIFMNDSITVQDIISYTVDNYDHTGNTNEQCDKDFYDYNITCDSLSLIMTGDWVERINAGVMIFRKTEFTKELLLLWHRLMILSEMNDQVSLAILLFGNQTMIWNAIGSSHRNVHVFGAKNQTLDMNSVRDDYDTKINELVAYLNENKQPTSKFILSVLHSNLGSVTETQAKYTHDVLLSNRYKSIVAFVKQSVMNNNIWNQFNNYGNMLGQWILHAAGQPSQFRQRLLDMFLNYKSNHTFENHVEIRRNVRNYCLQSTKNFKLFKLAKRWNTSFDKTIELIDKKNYMVDCLQQ